MIIKYEQYSQNGACTVSLQYLTIVLGGLTTSYAVEFTLFVECSCRSTWHTTFKTFIYRPELSDLERSEDV